jgi:hypothetical protein
MWKKIKHPVWWIIFLIALVPRYGICQIWYMLIFLIIDRGDEFQLVQYIMGFKAVQFLNLGIVSALVGAGQYYICLAQTNTHSCDDFAPTEKPYTLLLFAAQVILTYVAFAFIPFSEKKGGLTYQAKETGALTIRQQCKTESGRKMFWEEHWDAMHDQAVRERLEDDRQSTKRTRSRLLHLLIYDFITFVLCSGLLAWGLFGNQLSSQANISTRNGDSLAEVNWRAGMMLYWVKTLYGILSLPFFLLNLPVLSSVLVHVRPTAYNPWGVTVPLLGKADPNAPLWSATQTEVVSA